VFILQVAVEAVTRQLPADTVVEEQGKLAAHRALLELQTQVAAEVVVKIGPEVTADLDV
jgi:hypothetical protein